MSDPTTYANPLSGRYASAEMRFNFSPQKKFTTWRKLWLALAESERELGLPISEDQIGELRATVETLNLDVAEEYERKLRHDVMSHVHAGDSGRGSRWVSRCAWQVGSWRLGGASR